MVRHEVEYQSDIAVGIPFLMYKLPDLRKLVQASSWACADFCPGTSGPLTAEPSLLHDPVDLIASVVVLTMNAYSPRTKSSRVLPHFKHRQRQKRVQIETNIERDKSGHQRNGERERVRVRERERERERVCQAQLYFVARPEPTRVRWKSDQVHTTSLETREAQVQECNGVKSVHDSTLSLSLGWLCAQADCDTHRCWNKILLQTAHWSFVMRSLIPLSASVPLNNMTLSCNSLRVPSSHFMMFCKNVSRNLCNGNIRLRL